MRPKTVPNLHLRPFRSQLSVDGEAVLSAIADPGADGERKASTSGHPQSSSFEGRGRRMPLPSRSSPPWGRVPSRQDTRRWGSMKPGRHGAMTRRPWYLGCSRDDGWPNARSADNQPRCGALLPTREVSTRRDVAAGSLIYRQQHLRPNATGTTTPKLRPTKKAPSVPTPAAWYNSPPSLARTRRVHSRRRRDGGGGGRTHPGGSHASGDGDTLLAWRRGELTVPSVSTHVCPPQLRRVLFVRDPCHGHGVLLQAAGRAVVVVHPLASRVAGASIQRVALFEEGRGFVRDDGFLGPGAGQTPRRREEGRASESARLHSARSVSTNPRSGTSVCLL